MEEKKQLSELAAEKLLENSPTQLYEMLGMRLKAVQDDIGKQGSFEPDVAYSDHMGAMDELSKLGQRVFKRISKEAYGLVCGSDEGDKDDRKTIVDALNLSSKAAVIALSGVLVSSFGLAAAVASVIAALIIKRFAKPAGEEALKFLCDTWKEYV